MITMEDLCSVINNNVLHDLFQGREDVLQHLSQEDKRNIELLYEKRKETRKKLTNSLDNIPICFEKCKEQIMECVENHIESAGNINAYFDEKLYKTGIIDGITFILESMRKKDETRNCWK